jgi:cell division protein FtsW
VAGLVLALILSCVDYRKYSKWVWWIYGISCFLLALCYVPGIGRQINGESRWINVGLQFQPSECAKICVMMVLARYYALYNMQAKSLFRGFIIPGLIFALPIGLILFEKDMGTAAALAVAGVCVMFVSGCNLAYLGGIFCLGAVGLAMVVQNSANRMERIQAWMDLETYKLGAGLQQYRAQIALGRGGFEGVGLGNSAEKHGFLPFSHTDFIFAPLGEEFGFIGTFSVLLAFLLMLFGGIMMAVNTRDRFGRIWAIGILMMIFMPAMLNIAVVTAALPNSGLPLPFISFGGTNLVFTLGAIGILTSIQRYSDPLGSELDIDNKPSSKEIIRL